MCYGMILSFGVNCSKPVKTTHYLKKVEKTVCRCAASAGFTGVRSPTVLYLSGEADY